MHIWAGNIRSRIGRSNLVSGLPRLEHLYDEISERLTAKNLLKGSRKKEFQTQFLFWFTQVFSDDGKSQLVLLNSEASSFNGSPIPTSSADPLDDVLEAYRRYDATDKCSAVSTCLSHLHLADLRQKYDSFIHKLTVDKDEALRARMTKFGLRVGIGYNLKAAAPDWVLLRRKGISLGHKSQEEIDILREQLAAEKRNEFRHEIFHAKLALAMKKAFGMGIFALFPSKTQTIFRAWDKAVTIALIEEIVREVPELREISDGLAEVFVEPLLAGKKVDIKGLSPAKLGPMTFPEIIQYCKTQTATNNAPRTTASESDDNNNSAATAMSRLHLVENTASSSES